MDALISDNKQVRKTIKSQRAKLSPQQLHIAACRVSKHFKQLKLFAHAKKIASYVASNGEVSPFEITNQLHSSRIFLPRVTNFRSAKMAFYSSNNKLIQNRFNLREPIALGSPEDLRSFDIILVPLVAFDRGGNRLGMGGGFYDRVLSFKKQKFSLSRPYLIGVAHHFQEVDSIVPQPWDVPLDAILTDHELINISI